MEFGVFEVLASIGIFVYILYYYYTANFDYWKNKNVKGPKPVPFFGNFKDMILQKKHSAEVFDDFYKEFRNEPVIGVFAQKSPVLILKDPEIIKNVIIKDFNVFSDRGLKANEDIEPLSAHLVTLETERWRPLRNRLSPVFTSGKLKEMFYLITECGEHFEKYLEKVTANPGSIEVRELTAKFTTDSIGVCAFGLNMNSLENEDSEFRRIGRKMFDTDFLTTLKRSLRDLSPTLLKLLYPILFSREVETFFISLMKDTIDYRTKNDIRRNDFVDLLMDIRKNPEKINNIEFTDTFMTAQALVFFAAGFETSSTTISNALYELAQNPDIQMKLRNEIKAELKKNGGKLTYESIKSMQYLDKVFKETLRKYPPGTALVRKALKEYTFSDLNLTVPKGTRVFVPVYSIHHDEDLYPEPDKFDPERFDPEMEKTRHSMNYLPFGDGPRNCIGARFAIYQSKLGIIKVIQNYEVEVSEKMRVPYEIDPRGFVLTPKGGIHLKFKKYYENL